jgi:hypothetical protein
VRYVWRGRTTGLTGQDVPIRLGSFAPILRGGRAVASTRSAVKEAVKVVLGRLGHPRWVMYGANRVCRPCTLRDGRRAWEFLRTNPSWGGPGESATAAGIGEVLTPRMLDRLVSREGVAVVYTHLGKVRDRERPFDARTEGALRLLARMRDERKIFVTTTQRLLRYLTVRDSLRCRSAIEGERFVVTLEAVEDPVSGPRPPAARDLDGLTLGVATTRPVELRTADGSSLPAESCRGSDGTNWVRLPWPTVPFPDLGGC